LSQRERVFVITFPLTRWPLEGNQDGLDVPGLASVPGDFALSFFLADT